MSYLAVGSFIKTTEPNCCAYSYLPTHVEQKDIQICTCTLQFLMVKFGFNQEISKLLVTKQVRNTFL